MRYFTTIFYSDLDQVDRDILSAVDPGYYYCCHIGLDRYEVRSKTHYHIIFRADCYHDAANVVRRLKPTCLNPRLVPIRELDRIIKDFEDQAVWSTSFDLGRIHE